MQTGFGLIGARVLKGVKKFGRSHGFGRHVKGDSDVRCDEATAFYVGFCKRDEFIMGNRECDTYFGLSCIIYLFIALHILRGLRSLSP